MHSCGGEGVPLATLPRMATVATSRTSIDLWWKLPLGSVLLAVAVLAAQFEPRLLPLAYLAVVTPALCVADVTQRRLPNNLVMPGYLVAVVGALTQWFWTGQPPLEALVSAVAYFVFMLVFSLTGGMGMGDVKLAGVLGICAGLIGAGTAVASPVAAFVLGGVAALVALRRGAGASIPFGPFMLAGFWVAVVLSP